MAANLAATTPFLVQALLDSRAYPHPAEDIGLVETHISWVFLAGEFAYKVKKPLRLPFLDYTTLAARERFCREELRLNSRTAPSLYLDVVPIGGGARPRVGVDKPLLDWALRMRRFPQQALLLAMARDDTLLASHVDGLAEAVSALHAKAQAASRDSDFGTPERVAEGASNNFKQMGELSPPPDLAQALGRLARWTRKASAQLAPAFAQRKACGFVR